MADGKETKRNGIINKRKEVSLHHTMGNGCNHSQERDKTSYPDRHV